MIDCLVAWTRNLGFSTISNKQTDTDRAENKRSQITKALVIDFFFSPSDHYLFIRSFLVLFSLLVHYNIRFSIFNWM